MAMNLVILTGRLVKDPELKYGASGTAYCRFSIAVGRAFQKDKTDFISCTAFGKTAELVGEYLKKGSLTGVQGRLEQNEVEKDGKKEYKTGVSVEKIEFLETRKENETIVNTTNKNGKYDNKTPKEILKGEPTPDINFDDDDIFPF